MDKYILHESHLHAAPSGKERWKWLGPAFIWMLSSAGSGELLFTPGVAALYGYTLLWAMLLAIIMKGFINHEIGRYTACTGATFLKGLEVAFGGRSWPLLFILIPQLVVAVATLSGLAGAASTALYAMIPVPPQITIGFILAATTTVVLLNKFSLVEKITTALAIVISLTILVAAVSTNPDIAMLGKGLVPHITPELNITEVLPWLGFLLSGAAGLMWFSYWIQAVGYGAARTKPEHPLELPHTDTEKTGMLRNWIRQLSIANIVAIGGGFLIAFAFLILGAELLHPHQQVPQANNMAQVLGTLLGGIWGTVGFWVMIVAVFITFTSGVLAAQDGFARMYTDGIELVCFNITKGEKILNEKKLKAVLVVTLLSSVPLLVFLKFKEPVELLKLAGVVEAIHIPVVAAFILYMNHKTLSPSLRPGWLSLIGTAMACVFFTTIGVMYLTSR